MKKKKYQTVKIVERGKIDTPYTKIRDHSLFWFGTGTSRKSGWVKRQL